MCQCPTRAGLHFYLFAELCKMSADDCVNALHGRDYISTFAAGVRENKDVLMCQCPTRAGLHFYSSRKGCCRSVWTCQCPTRAGLYFYDTYSSWCNDIDDGTCQCPTRAGLHFYNKFRPKPFVSVKVSMPYTGGTTFLRYVSARTESTLSEPVSMPYTGGTTFLLAQKGNYYGKLRECQCPTRAGLHFYPTSLRPSVYAGFKPLFFAHFSEYSDILAKQGVKVGKGRIVFFREQFRMFFIV